jgi:hypothetical protein
MKRAGASSHLICHARTPNYYLRYGNGKFDGARICEHKRTKVMEKLIECELKIDRPIQQKMMQNVPFTKKDSVN